MGSRKWAGAVGRGGPALLLSEGLPRRGDLEQRRRLCRGTELIQGRSTGEGGSVVYCLIKTSSKFLF